MDDAKFQAFKDQTIETTKEIIGNTLTSLGPHSMMSFQFHPGANLLVITGSTDEISISRKIINAMIEQPDVINRFGPGPPRTRAVPAPQPMIPVPAPPGNAPQIPPVPRPQPIQ
jgi:hypothetical protein